MVCIELLLVSRILIFYYFLLNKCNPSRSDVRGQTSDLSWWPKQTTFETSGLFFGYWTQTCEQWFQKRSADIVAHRADLKTAEQWYQCLKFNKQQTKKVLQRSHKETLAYLEGERSNVLR